MSDLQNAMLWLKTHAVMESSEARIILDRVEELEAALSGLLGIIEDPETRTIPQVVNAIKVLKG